MRGWLLRHGLFIQVVAILVCDSISSGPASLRKGSKCMRHYYVETIHHPKKICERKVRFCVWILVFFYFKKIHDDDDNDDDNDKDNSDEAEA